MSYDTWKTTPPADGGGGGGSAEQWFWRAYDFAVRQNDVEGFLQIYRPLRRFAALVIEADRREALRRIDGVAEARAIAWGFEREDMAEMQRRLK